MKWLYCKSNREFDAGATFIPNFRGSDEPTRVSTYLLVLQGIKKTGAADGERETFIDVLGERGEFLDRADGRMRAGAAASEQVLNELHPIRGGAADYHSQSSAQYQPNLPGYQRSA